MNQEQLSDLLAQQPWTVKAEGACINITNEDGVTAYLVAGESQILVETPLFPASSVTDTAALNDLILRTHHLVPLSTISLKPISGDDYYVVFGALSSDSKDSVIIEEVEMLFANVSEFLDLYTQHLNLNQEAAE